jgi:DnaJ-class molecular chaperone
MSHYDTLGVNQNASQDEIKAAFRKLAGQHHPDRGGDQAKFKEINEAYNNLGDPNKRAQYDQQMRGGFNPFAQQGAGNPFEFHFNMGGGHPFDMNDIFSQFGFQSRNTVRNRNLRVEVEVDFLSTLNPQQKVVQYPTSQGPETIQLDLPAGLENNTMFSVNGRGDNSHTNLPRGALEVLIRVAGHPRFQRMNEHVLEDITIDSFQAIIGHTIQLQTPMGKTIELTIPAGTQHGAQFAVTDEGFPRPNGTRGKYIIRVAVLTPTALTSDQLNLLAEIMHLRPVNT